MKRFLMLSILIAAVSISLMGTFAFADENMSRPANPGEDTVANQDKNKKASDVHAAVANPGFNCPLCASRLYQGRLHQNTNPPTKRPGSSEGANPEKGTR